MKDRRGRKLLKKIVPPWIVRYRGPSRGRRVALTFDDGQAEGLTDCVLDELRKRGHRATFFVVGERAAQLPQLLRAMLDQGCEIGNHTYSHPDLQKISYRETAIEIERTDEIIRSATGVRPASFRPPYGTLSWQVCWYLQRAGRGSSVLWSACTRGYEYDRTAEQIVHDLIDAEMGAGDIVLLHDANRNTVSVLPEILSLLESRQLELVTVRELLATPA